MQDQCETFDHDIDGKKDYGGNVSDMKVAISQCCCFSYGHFFYFERE